MRHDRQTALEGLAKILDAGAPEDLFTGPEADAIFLYDLLVETTRARSSPYYGEICRTARRHGVTPEYIVDRAVVLLGAMTERRRSDLYRILGVPPLASGEVVRRRWLDVARLHHPDVGGDGAQFRRAKQAYDVLGDPERRVQYERFWLRALGPFERVVPAEDQPLLEAMRASVRSEHRDTVAEAPVTAAPTPAPTPATPAPLAPAPAATDAPPAPLAAAARLLAARSAIDQRIAGVGRVQGLSDVLAAVDAAVAAMQDEDLASLQRDVQAVIGELERVQRELGRLAELRRRLAG